MSHSRAFLIIFVLLLFSFQGRAIDGFISNCIFYSPGDGPYVETYITIPAHSLTFGETTNGKFQAAVEVTLLYKNGEDITAFEKYVLNSAEVESQDAVNFSMLDQKRIPLVNGLYSLEASLNDLNDEANHQTIVEPLIVDFPEEKVGISDLELVESISKTESESPYTKSGLEVVPYAFNFFPGHLNNLQFYAEIYNSNKHIEGDGFLVTYAIHKKDKQVVFDNFNRFRKHAPEVVVPLIGEFDISELPSGNFDLVVEVKDKENNLIARNKKFFQRLNINTFSDLSAYTEVDVTSSFVEDFSKEELVHHVNSLMPIATVGEQSYIRKITRDKELVRMRQFFLNFWANKNPGNPKHEWENYQSLLVAVEDQFGTQIHPGFETSRGIIYLQYGSPNDIQKNREPGAKPYEIWTYYNLPNGQTQGKFIFANLTLMPNDYEMLHSTVTGEIQDTRWRMRVYDSFKEQSNGLDLDQEGMRDHFGTKLDDIWDE